jgi:hypothetical protein
MVRVGVDFAWNEHLQEALLAIREHHGTILDFEPTGPGGGNPHILLQFPDQEKALLFLNARYPDDGTELNLSRLEIY